MGDIDHVPPTTENQLHALIVSVEGLRRDIAALQKQVKALVSISPVELHYTISPTLQTLKSCQCRCRRGRA